MNLLTNWIFSVLLSIVPANSYSTLNESEDKMKERYASIANDMYEAIHESKPLFNGEDAELKSAALITSIAYFESGFNKNVDSGKIKGDNGNSWCLMQINIGKNKVPVGNEEMQQWTGQDLIKDRKKCFKVSIEFLRNSFKACSGYSKSDVLSGYTSGRCIKNESKAAIRWNFAGKLLKNNPFPIVKIDEGVADKT